MSPANKVDVEIYGEHYKLKGEASPEYMTRLARYVDQTMYKVMQRNPRLSVHKAAVLSAINITDELMRLLDGREENNAAVSREENAEPAKDDGAGEAETTTGTKKKGKKKKG